MSNVISPKYSITMYILSAWSGALEIALPVAFILNTKSIIFVGIGMTIFQCGYISREIFAKLKVGVFTALIIMVISTSVLTLSFILKFTYGQLGSLFLVASGIRYLRSYGKENFRFNTNKNNYSRQIGYILGGLLSYQIPYLCLLGLVPSALIFSNRYAFHLKPKPTLPSSWLKKQIAPFVIFEFFHSLHYFTYCYILLLIFWHLLQSYGFLIGAIFALGWVGYNILYVRLTTFQRLPVILGHMVVGLCLLAMIPFTNLMLLILLWILTGFGGGTNFAVRFGIRNNIHQLFEYRDTAESAGHILGPLLGCLIVYYINISMAFIISCIFSFIAASAISFALKDISEKKVSDS